MGIDVTILKCSKCGADRILTKESAYEATRLNRLYCRPCGRKFGERKISKYAEKIGRGDKFGQWVVIGSFLGNGSTIECQCTCGAVRKLRASTLIDGTSTQCRKCSVGEKSSNWKGIGRLPSTVYTVIQLRAKNRGKTFNVTKEYLSNLYDKQKGLCGLTGMPINFDSSKGKNLACSKGTASLDRINSSIGYEIGNVQWVHKHVNSMKNSYTTKEFVDLCRKVVDYCDKNRAE